MNLKKFFEHHTQAVRDWIAEHPVLAGMLGVVGIMLLLCWWM